jgi:hypothetical protein
MEEIAAAAQEIATVVNVRFEWDTSEYEFKLFPKTSIKTLIRRFEKNQKMSGIAFFYGDVELNGTNTFAECNIPEGAILTVRRPKRKREDSPAPALRGRASSERQETSPLPPHQVETDPPRSPSPWQMQKTPPPSPR